ncbi:hypothetical protein [Staphylococcus sp. LCT-H4]|uniref:hypothetical protein n=1 Tax=Staphylococcus sp. LCT-H4 TaxID=1914308 RepID=UPI0008F52AF2|nr:hypothetical protein [Staphylococcus sp. LCT-H4]OIJ29031.1 hypothetical protein BK821_12320 [Staphylococcus sp. LCT-H4]
MVDYTQELRDKDNTESVKIRREVNTQTGEIRNKDPKYIDYDVYLEKKTKRYDRPTVDKEERFFNLVAEFQTSLKEKYNVSFEDLGKLLHLFTYTSYRDLESKKLYLKDGKHAFDNKKLAKVLKLTDTQIKKFKARMKEKGIMFTDKTGIYFTDELVIRGEMFPKEKRNLNFYTVYDHPIRELYNMFAVEGDTKSVKPLGVLLTLIPFIKKLTNQDRGLNREASNNMLVMTEWNEKAQRYEPISLTRVAEMIGVSKKTLIKDIKTLNEFTKKETGEFLVYKYQSSLMPVGFKFKHTTEAIVINPKYTYSQDKNNSNYHNLISAIENISSNNNVINLNDYK